MCCLKTLCSIWRISVRLTERASIKLTTMRTYSSICVFHRAEPFSDVRALGADGQAAGRSPCVLGFVRFPLSARFLFLPSAITVIGDTAPSGLPLAVSCPAAKGTTQVFTTGITRMSQEKDPAMPAPGQASA